MPASQQRRSIIPANDGQPSKAPSSRRRQTSVRISAACEACKKRKTKCTGGPSPCQLCKALGTECVIDLTLDMRRRAALQRAMDDSKAYQDNLNGLIDIIREGPSSRLDSLLDVIRAGVTNAQIAELIQRHVENAVDQDFDHGMMSQEQAVESPSDEDDAIHTSLNQVDGGPVRGRAEHCTLDGASITSAASGPGKVSDTEELSVSALLVTLREGTFADGEILLRRLLASTPSRSATASSWSSDALRVPLGGTVPTTTQPGVAERARWHPALHAQMPNSRSDAQLQMPEMLLDWRPSEEGIGIVKSEELAQFSGSFMRTLPRRSSGPVTDIVTDVPFSSAPRDSPNTPYLEVLNISSSATPGATSRDLSVAQEKQSTRLRVPRHLVLPLVIPDDSYMSRTYTYYLQGARKMLRTGVPLSDVLGGDDEVAIDLFFRPRAGGDKFDCASWACEVCRSYESDVFARLASAYLLTFMMRWLLAPTRENYQNLPEMMQPTPSQCMIPHIGAIETIPIPLVRDAAIHRLRDWITPANWSVNWPHGMDAAVQRSRASGATVLTSVFVEHVIDYNNWSVSSHFVGIFPEVAGRIRVHDS